MLTVPCVGRLSLTAVACAELCVPGKLGGAMLGARGLLFAAVLSAGSVFLSAGRAFLGAGGVLSVWAGVDFCLRGRAVLVLALGNLGTAKVPPVFGLAFFAAGGFVVVFGGLTRLAFGFGLGLALALASGGGGVLGTTRGSFRVLLLRSVRSVTLAEMLSSGWVEGLSSS